MSEKLSKTFKMLRPDSMLLKNFLPMLKKPSKKPRLSSMKRNLLKLKPALT